MRHLLLCVPLLAGCGLAPAMELRPTENPQVQVEKLFEVDGCTIYRFRDGPAPRYFTRCSAAAPSSVAWDENCGKGCVWHHTVDTSGY